MTSDDVRQRVFRRMLAREAGPGASAPAIAAAAGRLCEHFTEQLTALIGEAGVAAICAHSLHLTARNVRGLTSIPTADRGDAPFALLQLFLEQQDPAAAAEASVAVLATASELLVSFIGEDLTTSLLREAWPEDFAGDASENVTT